LTPGDWVEVSGLVANTYERLKAQLGEVEGARATIAYYEERFLQAYFPAEDIDFQVLLARQAAIRVAKLIVAKQQKAAEQEEKPV
jgi:hypothetical protein